MRVGKDRKEKRNGYDKTVLNGSAAPARVLDGHKAVHTYEFYLSL